MNLPVEQILLAPDAKLRDVLACIDRTAKGIALVADGQRKLLGTLTDGDIRRAILAGQSIDLEVQQLLAQRKGGAHAKPYSAPVGTPAAELLRQMNKRSIRHIPLLDAEGRIADVALLTDLVKDCLPEIQAVIMAGGQGMRLRPLTEHLPKPMLPVGGRPVMERIIDQLRTAGIHRVNVTTHFMPEKIKDHFGDGSRYGVEINYINEDMPLGTAGALGLMPQTNEPLLVMNGDIVTNVDLRALTDFHREHQAEITVGVRRYAIQVPYGVVDCDGARVQGIREKPNVSFFVNAGVYLLEPSACREVVPGQRMDMPHLIQGLIDQKRTVVSFPIIEYWLDIGQHQDYQRAQDDVNKEPA